MLPGDSGYPVAVVLPGGSGYPVAVVLPGYSGYPVAVDIFDEANQGKILRMQQKPEHAFDRIDINQLFIALEFYGIPEKKLLKVIKMTLDENSSEVLTANNSSRRFYVRGRVNNGDAVSIVILYGAVRGLEETAGSMRKPIHCCNRQERYGSKQVLWEMKLKMGLILNEN